jgi:hypothetical protein
LFVLFSNAFDIYSSFQPFFHKSMDKPTCSRWAKLDNNAILIGLTKSGRALPDRLPEVETDLVTANISDQPGPANTAVASGETLQRGLHLAKHYLQKSVKDSTRTQVICLMIL